MKVLILSCSTGEGHNSAAKALADNLTDNAVECEVLDVLSFKSERAARGAAKLYNGIIRKGPAIFGVVYRLGGIYDRLHLPSPIYAYNASYAKKLCDYIQDNAFTHVVCAHLFAMEAVTAGKRKYGLNVKTYGVLTDYTTIPFYKDTDLDGYFVSDDAVKKGLVKAGIEESKIFATGIPVSPRCSLPVSKAQAREELALPCERKIVVVMSGGAGCGQIVKLCRALDKALGDDCLILAFPGKNGKLKEKLERVFAQNPRVRTVAFTAQMHLYMKSADVVLSKAGGLTATEVAVSNVPFVHLKAIPGCETANINFFTSYGLSLRGDNVKRAVAATERLLTDKSAVVAMKKRQSLFVKENGTQKITEIITEDKKDGSDFMASVHSGRVFVG